MRSFVVTLIASGGAALAAGLTPAPVTATPFPALAVMPQDAAIAPGTVTPAGVRYWYGNRHYLPYCGDRPYYRRCNGDRPRYRRYRSDRPHHRQYNGYRPYYPGYDGYYPYYAPLPICGTMLCYQPRYFMAPAW